MSFLVHAAVGVTLGEKPAPAVEAVCCITPGNLMDPINLLNPLSKEDAFLGRGGAHSSNERAEQEEVVAINRGEWRKLIVNKYYGAIRDLFYVRNCNGRNANYNI